MGGKFHCVCIFMILSYMRSSQAISNMAAPMNITYSMLLMRRAAASDSVGQKPGELTLQRDQRL